MKIKIIPNILSREGRSEFVPVWVKGKTVGEYLRDRKIKTKGMRVIVSGKIQKNLKTSVKKIDEIIVTPKIEDPISAIVFAIGAAALAGMGASIATVAAFATITGWAIIAGVVGIATFAVMSAFSSPRKPSNGTTGSGGIDSNSPTYGWDGVQTVQNVGTPIGVIYGEHKVGGNVINQFISNDGDKNYLHTLLALGEGEIESISDIKVNDNPIENYEGITTAQVLGTNSQAPIAGFEDLHDVNTVAVALNHLNDAHTYTMSGSDVVGFEVLITFPAGIYFVTSGGGVAGASCQLKIEYKLHSSGTWTELGTYTVNESNRSAVRRIYRKDGLTSGNYDVRVTRLSVAGDLTTINDLTWTHADELRDDSLSYPNTAILALNYLATDQLSGGMPNITCIVKGKKILAPSVLTTSGGTAVAWDLYYYDPVAELFKLLSDNSSLYWDGTTYATVYCANPVWVIYDLLKNTRYGIGEHIDTSHIDLVSFLEMAKYCDEKVPDGNGGYEKRFRMDCVIDSESRAVDALMQLATTFRAIFFFAENAIKLKIDKPELSAQMFTMGNIVADSFMQKWKSVKEVPNVMQVQFLDKGKDYQQEIVSFVDDAAIAAGDPVRKKEIRLFCTRVSQAIREARYLIHFSKYIDRAISFKAGIDALACQVGDVIDFCHDVPQWGYSGRVVSAASTSIVTLDRPVTIVAGKTYSLQVRHADDTLETKEITTAAGAVSTVTVSPAFSFTPTAYDLYSFGEELIVTKPFRIMSISREPNNEVGISAVEYNASVYDDSAVVLPTSNYSALDNDIADVANLALTEGVIVVGEGGAQTIDVWFTPPDDSGRSAEFRWAGAKIFISDNDRASWRYAGIASGPGFQITGVQPSTEYYVAAVSVAASGMENSLVASPQNSITTTAGASIVAPLQATNLTGTFLGNRLTLRWDPLGIVPSGYEIRDNNTDWGTVDGHQIFQGVVNSFVFTPAAYSGIIYYVRAFNKGGYATTSSSVTPAKDLPATITGMTGTFDGNNLTLAFDPLSVTPDGYEIRTEDDNWGDDDAARVYIGTSNSFRFVPADHSGITYYVKGFNVRGYAATAEDVTPTKSVPADVAGFSNSWDGKVLSLKWTALATAPDGYEIRDEDDNWGTVDAHQIYVGSANATSFQPAAFSGVTYYIKAVNWAGYSATADATAPDMPVPADVTGFDYAFETNLITLTWTPNSITPVAYEIRTADTNWGTVNYDLIYQGLATSFVIEATARSGVTYYIRAINDSGEYSANAVHVHPANAAPGAISGLGADIFFNVARLFWTNSSDGDILKYEVYKSETNAWGGEETFVGDSAGGQLMIEGHKPRSGNITSVTSKSVFIVDSLIGYDDDYFNGDFILCTNGINNGRVRTISDFNGTTGEITVSADFEDTPGAADQILITDNAFYKVRAVDHYGVGTLSSAYTVAFEGIDENMIGDNVITARKIYVACLSAMSANLGCVTAGVLEGACVQTAGGGQRLLLKNDGMYGYDSSCCQKLRICTDGSIVAQSAKFQDPSCDCCYSYVNAGAMTFHDECGDVPYVKRIKSGVNCTGSTICLPGWKTKPEVMVGINALKSYASNCSAQDQKWDVSYTEPVSYSGGGQYGYCFAIHATLELTSGSGTEYDKVCAYTSQTFCTVACVCAVCVKSNLLYFCNAAAPGNYYYGVLSYQICYRKVGDPSYCCCSFTYTQPHGSAAQVYTTSTHVACLCFPCLATWELKADEISVSWCDSGFSFGTRCCSCCLWTGSCASISWACLSCQTSWAGYTGVRDVCVNFGSAPAPDCDIYFSRICYRVYGYVCVTYSPADTWSGSNYLCWGFLDNSSVSCYSMQYRCALPPPTGTTTRCCGLSNCLWDYNTGNHGLFPFCFRSIVNTPYSNSWHWICAGCLTNICQTICYYSYYYVGNACCVKSCCVRSIKETFGGYTVLDPTGMLNWLAIAYT